GHSSPMWAKSRGSVLRTWIRSVADAPMAACAYVACCDPGEKRSTSPLGGFRSAYGPDGQARAKGRLENPCRLLVCSRSARASSTEHRVVMVGSQCARHHT